MNKNFAMRIHHRNDRMVNNLRITRKSSEAFLES